MVIAIDRLAVVAAASDVVECASKFKPKWSGHFTKIVRICRGELSARRSVLAERVGLGRKQFH
jgi:hypothetical protein